MNRKRLAIAAGVLGAVLLIGGPAVAIRGDNGGEVPIPAPAPVQAPVEFTPGMFVPSGTPIVADPGDEIAPGFVLPGFLPDDMPEADATVIATAQNQGRAWVNPDGSVKVRSTNGVVQNVAPDVAAQMIRDKGVLGGVTP